jgi:hypothetical protein
MRQRAASEQSNTSLFLHLLVFLVLLSCFSHLCCFEEKINRFSLMRQGLTLFHVSHQVFIRTYFGDSAGDDVHVLIVAPSFSN